MTGSISGVNMFYPAVSVEDMNGLANSEGKHCETPGTILNWVEYEKNQ